MVLLDLSMPEVDGVELLSKLEEEHPDLPVVIMSGHGQGYVRNRLGDHEVSAILHKPFGVEELHRAIGARMRNADSEDFPQRVPDSKRYDPESQSLN